MDDQNPGQVVLDAVFFKRLRAINVITIKFGAENTLKRHHYITNHLNS